MSHLSRPPRGQQRDKPYREALRMELAAAGDNMKKTALHIARCEAGDMQAIKDLADRLDGRPAQILEHNGPDSEPIGRIVRESVQSTCRLRKYRRHRMSLCWNGVEWVMGLEAAAARTLLGAAPDRVITHYDLSDHAITLLLYCDQCDWKLFGWSRSITLAVALVIDRLAAMLFIALPIRTRRAAVAGSRAYRKWRGAAPLRGR